MKQKLYLQLQARTSSANEWGTLSSVFIQRQRGNPALRDLESANKQIESIKSRWLEINPALEFRVVQV